MEGKHANNGKGAKKDKGDDGHHFNDCQPKFALRKGLHGKNI